MKTAITVPARKYKWGFFKVETISLPEGEFICGFIAKYCLQEIKEYAIPENLEIEEREAEHRIEAKSRFFLHARTGMIAFKKVSKVKSKTFILNFKKLLDIAFLDSGLNNEAEIEIINKEKEFFESIRALDSFKRIQVKLHPSNPNHRRIWHKVDDRMQNLGIETINQTTTFEGNGRHIDIEADPDINAMLHMAGDGYGHAKVLGNRGGMTEIVSTEQSPVEAEVENQVENSGNNLEILNQIIPSFRSLFNRMEN